MPDRDEVIKAKLGEPLLFSHLHQVFDQELDVALAHVFCGCPELWRVEINAHWLRTGHDYPHRVEMESAGDCTIVDSGPFSLPYC